ncbi:MAG: hypothetical protein IJP02_02440 [Oscillospiraceae bacterium]|nr:hypothetical protein [Oscillospiraceae bacterium]
MKHQFKTPEVEVINFDVEDVVTASAVGGLTGESSGSGDSVNFGDLFPNV